jgi:hypothetical protein
MLLGEIALGDRALHFVRGLAGRDVGNEIAIEEFHVVDPARRARSDLRERSHFLRDAVDEFLGFFGDGEIRAEVDVEDPVEAKR